MAIVIAALLATAAVAIGTVLPLIGGPLLGLLLGVLLRSYVDGQSLAATGRTALQAGIVLFGFRVTFGDVLAVGTDSLPVLMATLTVAFAGAVLLGRLLRLHPETTLLIGVGTGICGASAIAAVTSVVRPAESRVAYAMATIFAVNLAAVVTYPLIGHLLGLSDRAFGLWAGSAINDTSSVIAAATAFTPTAVTYAVVVKLARSLMIIPVCLALRLRHRTPGTRLFPLFILGFLATSAIASTGVIPQAAHSPLAFASTYLITLALTAIGLTVDPRALRAAGPRPLLFGTLLGTAVGATGLAVT